MYVHDYYSQIFLPGEILHQFHQVPLIGNFLSFVNLNHISKIYFTDNFCNAKVAGLGEIFVQQSFICSLVRHCIHVNGSQHELNTFT